MLAHQRAESSRIDYGSSQTTTREPTISWKPIGPEKKMKAVREGGAYRAAAAAAAKPLELWRRRGRRAWNQMKKKQKEKKKKKEKEKEKEEEASTI